MPVLMPGPLAECSWNKALYEHVMQFQACSSSFMMILRRQREHTAAVLLWKLVLYG